MSKGPVVKVFIEKAPEVSIGAFSSAPASFNPITLENHSTQIEEISEYIERLVYTESIYEDNQIELLVKTKHADTIINLIDNPKFITGKRLVFYFGYLAGALSNTYTTRFTNFRTRYAESISVGVLGTDFGTVLKAPNTGKIWTNMTSSEIAEAIAKKHGLAAVIDPTTKKWPTYPQGEKTDMETLQELVAFEDYYLCYVKGFTLYFVKVEMAQDARYKFNYGDKEVISFIPSHNENNNKVATVKAVGFDPETKKLIEGLSDAKPKLGKMDMKFSATGVFEDLVPSLSGSTISAKSGFEDSGTIKKLISASSDKKELKSKANQTFIRDSFRAFTAELTIEGRPNIQIGELVTVAGVARKHQGNWLIVKVRDSVSGGGKYLTTMELEKDGTVKALSAGSFPSGEDVNNSEGKNGPSRKVIEFDVNGNETGIITTEEELNRRYSSARSGMDLFKLLK